MNSTYLVMQITASDFLYKKLSIGLTIIMLKDLYVFINWHDDIYLMACTRNKLQENDCNITVNAKLMSFKLC